MGEVKKQTIQNTIIQYLGVVLGYINTVILFPMILDTDEFGLTRVFLAIAGIYVNLSSLGSSRVVVRFFPFFARNYAGNNGIFILSILLSFIGFVLVSLIYHFFKGPILSQYAEGSSLLIDNYYLTIPLSLGLLIFQALEYFLIAIRKTVASYFLKNIVIRLVWMIEILLYYFDLLNFDQFLLLFISSYYLMSLILFFSVISYKEITFPFKKFKVPFRLLKIVFNYGLFSILSGISIVLTNRIDVIMITFMLSLADNAVYSIAMYIASVVLVPMQTIARIAYPIVSDDWKAKRWDNMEKLYKQTSITQLIFGGFIFLCIWVNIDEIFTFFRPEYSNGKYVVLFIGLATLYDLVTGINHVIISVSKFYRLETYASIGLALATILTNYIFIPLYGITGAALATALSIIMYNTLKYWIIMKKLGIHPFSMHTLTVTGVLAGSYLLMSFVPAIEHHFFLTILMRCSILTAVYFSVIYALGVFPEMNAEVDKFLGRFRK